MSEGEKNFSKKERDLIDVYLIFPESLAREIESLAEKHGVSILTALGEFIDVGSMAILALEGDDSEMVLCRKDGYEEPFNFTTILPQGKDQNVKNVRLPSIWMKMQKEVSLELDYLAEKNDITTTQLLYSFIEFGLKVDKIDESPDYDLVLREKGQEDTKMALFEYEDHY